MYPIRRIFTIGLLALSLPTGGCSNKISQAEKKLPDFALSCVAVLPVVNAAASQQVTEKERKAQEQGRHLFNKSLKEYFGARSDIRLLSDGQDSGQRERPLDRAKAAAERLSCNAVLETTLHGYRERVGGEYTAKEPAAASFDYRLLAMPDGTVLCKGNFDEEQKSLMENLFNFNSGAENSFTWVTADRLMFQGLRDRLDACPYLADDNK